ncbi:MAG: DUF1573 domain-containing protein [Sphingobacteriales bacterium]|nr:DUF1573 domain-containing protein [Sphingobacteriales bacterium]
MILVGFIACNNTGDKKEDVQVKTNPLLDVNLDTIPKTTIVELDTVYNFGTITEGDSVTHNFHFVNTGKKPLIIQMARASCGCTVVDRPDKPIMPGDTGVIKATFNSRGKAGESVEKMVFVHSNADPEFPAFKIKGKVEKSTK